jgi:3-oxoacyl-[acyl-carrier protein] reductase
VSRVSPPMGRARRVWSRSVSRLPERSDRGIAVTAVAPGFTETEMAAAALSGEQGRRRRAESPLGRVATPEEVAAAVVYLAAPQAELASETVLDFNAASHPRL